MVTKLILLFFSSLALSSCASLIETLIQPPQVNVKDVQITQLGRDGVTLNLALNVFNPNTMSLKIDKFEYELIIGKDSFFKGTTETPSQLEANKESIIVIPLKLDYRSTFAAFDNLVLKGIRNYEVKGSAQTGLLNIPFQKREL